MISGILSYARAGTHKRAGPSEMINILEKILGRRTAQAARRSAFSVSVLFLALFSLAAFSPALVHADNPANNSDSITITVVPTVDVGVSIDTGNVNLTFVLAMGATDFTVSPATVTILGNIQPQEIELEAVNVGASPVWTLDTDEIADIDELQVYALFSVDRTTRPHENDFAGAKNLVTSSAKRAGKALGAGPNQNFENQSMIGEADMDNLQVGTQRQLWLRIDTPPLTTTAATQEISITATATKNVP